MATSPVVAKFVADIHWSDRCPIARTAESDWLLAQERYMEQLRVVDAAHPHAPVYIAGDLFHRWDCSPLLISAAIRWLRNMTVFAIPGNHEMPEHNYRQLRKSAYWTLVEAGAVKHLEPGGSYTTGNVVVSPFPFGHKVTPANRGDPSLCLHVALVHSYIWTEKTKHPTADPGSRLSAWKKRLTGYDVAVFGDNHKPFWVNLNGTQVINCGSMIPRSIDEKKHVPSVWLLRSDGSITRKRLDASKDVWLEGEERDLIEKQMQLDLSAFREELAAVQGERVDFAKAVMMFVSEREELSQDVKDCILRAIGGVFGGRG